MKVLLRIGLVFGVVLAALAAVNHASARTACHAGTFYKGTVEYTTYCGHASATIKVGGKSYAIKGGACKAEHNGPYKWSIAVGTNTYGGKPTYNYLRLDAQASSPGTSAHGGLEWQLKTGKSGSSGNAKVTLKSGLKSGSFTYGKGKHVVSATFHC